MKSERRRQWREAIDLQPPDTLELRLTTRSGAVYRGVFKPLVLTLRTDGGAILQMNTEGPLLIEPQANPRRRRKAAR